MGEKFSKEDYDRFAVDYYETAQWSPCLLPDAGLDESLRKYSGPDSHAALQAFSNLQVDLVPDFIDRLGSNLAPLTSVPNAVGLGALVISIIMEICIKSVPQTDNSNDMFRRVFGEEKASSVRDTMSEYLRRHRTFMNNNRRLQEELRRLESQLSNHLTILRNSLLQDGQMNTRGFKIWVNGAAFHVEMLIHEARLNTYSGRRLSEYTGAVRAAIDLYLMDLDHLLAEYKTYMSSKIQIYTVSRCIYLSCLSVCYIENYERNCYAVHLEKSRNEPCGGPALNQAFTDHIFSTYAPISGLRNHFLNSKNNLTYLINQHDSFTLPSAA